MNAISESGKVYVHILELHSNITDKNVRDNIPEIKIATITGSENINWAWIMMTGLMPIIKPSPSILRSTLKDYVFTPEFWICDCEFDWLRTKHFMCSECKSTVVNHMTCNPNPMKTTENLWGKGPFNNIETTIVQGMVAAAKHKDRNAVMPRIERLYCHLKAFQFNWIEAFAIENF